MPKPQVPDLTPAFRPPHRADMTVCHFYVSIQQPECGKEATGYAVVKLPSIQAVVPLCTQHKAQHDRISAERRTLGRKRTPKAEAQS